MVHPTNYARFVKKIGNGIDSTHVDLIRLLPSITVMLVSEMTSTAIAKPFAKEVLRKTINAYDRILRLDRQRKRSLLLKKI